MNGMKHSFDIRAFSYHTGNHRRYRTNKNMFIDALVQFDPRSRLLNSNVRFNWIHSPLSDVFIVWNEQRFETGEGIRPGRSLTIKVTKMLAF